MFFRRFDRLRVFQLSSLLFFLSTISPSQAEELSRVAPEEVGIDSGKLSDMSAWIRSENLDVRSLVLLRRGKLALEWYSADVTRDHNHNLYSVTKSVVGLLAGIAVDQGKVPNAETTVGELLPRAKGKPAGSVTLAQLLTMRSGLPVSRGNLPGGAERELFDRVNAAGDRTSLILNDLDFATESGKAFTYNNIDPQLVASAIAAAAGEPLSRFAEKNLFEPLGFKNTAWMFSDSTGQVPGGYGLRLRSIDLAKLGQLVLDQGSWNGTRLISSEWIEAATSDQTGTGYGYYWWLDRSRGVVGGKGVRGQRLEIVPALELVFVVTAELPPARVAPVTNRLLRDFVLPSIRVSGKESLPENPEAISRLEAELAEAARFRPASREGLPGFRLPK